MNLRPARWLAPILYSGRGRIIVGVMLLFALMTAAVVADMLRRQHEFMEQQLAQQGAGLARILAVNAPSWLLSNDVHGLNELVGSLASTPNLHLALILDNDGRVRASSDETLFNLVLDDEPSRRLLAAPPGSRQIRHDAMVDSMA